MNRKKLLFFAVPLFLAVAIYTVLVKPRRYVQCLASPLEYIIRDYGETASRETASSALPEAALPEAVNGNQVRLLVNGSEALPAMLELIASAQRSIRWQVMLFFPDSIGQELAQALADASRRGVRVQLSFNIDQTTNGTLADWLNQGQKTDRRRQMQAMLSMLREAGVDVRNNPAQVDFDLQGVSPRARENQETIQKNVCISANHYDHRKLLIVDDQIAMVGGMNVGMHYLYHLPPAVGKDMVVEAQERREQDLPEAWEKWFDSMAVIEGPVVAAMVDEFNWKWEVLGGKPLAVINSPAVVNEGGVPVQFLSQRPGQPQIGARFFELVDNAREEIWVASPFVSYDPALEALMRASRRGVRVVFVFPNQRQEMGISRRILRESADTLVAAGIELYFNDLRMAHTKLMVVDNRQVLLGSFNLNHRSFRHDLETAVVVEDEAFARQVVERVFHPYLEISNPVKEPLNVTPNPINWFAKPFT